MWRLRSPPGAPSSTRCSLMLACYAGHLDVVKYLRRHGASWEARDLGGCTALHWAADGGHCDVIEWMMKDGCEVRALLPHRTQAVPSLKRGPAGSRGRQGPGVELGNAGGSPLTLPQEGSGSPGREGGCGGDLTVRQTRC